MAHLLKKSLHPITNTLFRLIQAVGTQVSSHRNNIGVVRLALASAVIISHSAEFVDGGNRRTEPLIRLFHTLSMGDVAVAAFFLLSGYLITQSYLSASSPSNYLLRRVLRIFPAFLVAYFISMFIVGPLVGCNPATALQRIVFGAVALREPMLDGVHLDQPAWTIVYEFRCYLLTLALGAAGLLCRPRWVLLLTGLTVLAAFLAEHHAISWRFQGLEHLPLWEETVGTVYLLLRLTAPYLVGACFFLFREQIKPYLTPGAAALGLVACVALLGINVPLACFGLSTFGAVALFWLVLHAKLGKLQRINERWDISYGVYLYGWGLQMLLVAYVPGITAVQLAVAALAGAMACGAASWWGIEKRAKDLLRRRPSLGMEGRDLAAAVR